MLAATYSTFSIAARQGALMVIGAHDQQCSAAQLAHVLTLALLGHDCAAQHRELEAWYNSTEALHSSTIRCTVPLVSTHHLCVHYLCLGVAVCACYTCLAQSHAQEHFNFVA